MTTLHVPVMLDEVLQILRPRPGESFADLTLGGGGYAEAILQRGASVLGFDRDPAAIARCRERLAEYGDRFEPHHGEFASLSNVLDEKGVDRVDGICMDLGLSSDQLEDAARGFSYRHDGPLDLRFDPAVGTSAATLVEEAEEQEILRWLSEWGEVRRARRLARILFNRSRQGRMRTTGELREAVKSTMPAHAKSAAELARVFQALRIATNSELRQLDDALAQVPARLNPGGRFVAVSYHSLEDGRVKSMLRRASGYTEGSRHVPVAETPVATMRVLTRKPMRPSAAEVQLNPRARSARLRAGERLS